MSFNAIRELLESDELYADAAVADDLRAFLRITAANLATQALEAYVQRSPENLEVVARYADELLTKAEDNTFRYENDVALCACMVVLAPTASPEAERLLAVAERTPLPSLVWVREVARALNARRPSCSTMRIRMPSPVNTTATRYVTYDPFDAANGSFPQLRAA